MRLTLAVLTFCVYVSGLALAADDKQVLGAWEGESVCTIRDSPCHDEHVVYDIASDPHGPADRKLEIDAFKIVNNEKQFMGTLHCKYAAPTLSCTGNTGHDDLWTFTVEGSTMTGELRIDKERKLYRKIRVSRKR